LTRAYLAAYAYVVDTRQVLKVLEDERARQGLSKAALASRAGLQRSEVSKLLGGVDDVKLSTLLRLSAALGAELSLALVDEGMTKQEARACLDRLRRRHLAEDISRRRGHDAGDVEHALRFLDLTPTERLARGLGRG
jgi:transcriptional regulator with XRE-family HTH domain